MAAASVIPGLGPFGDVRSAAADVGPPIVSAGSGSPDATGTVPTTGSAAPLPSATRPATLKALLGNTVPPGWEPHRARTEAKKPAAAPGDTGGDGRVPSIRDAAATARPSDRPTLRRPVRGESGT